MINDGVKYFCKDDISLIENFEKAVADSNTMWECHHRKGITTSKKELLEIGEYYNRPASELIFLTKKEHRILHFKGKHMSEEAKRKISEANKDNKNWLGRHHTEESRNKMAKSHKGKILSEEAKQKLSTAMKGLYYFNNGIKNVRAKSCPEGFVKGMIKRTSV